MNAANQAINTGETPLSLIQAKEGEEEGVEEEEEEEEATGIKIFSQPLMGHAKFHDVGRLLASDVKLSGCGAI